MCVCVCVFVYEEKERRREVREREREREREYTDKEEEGKTFNFHYGVVIILLTLVKECNSFLKKKIFDWQSSYQSVTIPIPSFPRVDSSVNFVGRLTNEMLNQTNYNRTVYVASSTTN